MENGNSNSKPAGVKGILAGLGLFTPEQVAEVLAHQQASGRGLTESILDKQFAKEDEYLPALAKTLNLPFVRMGDQRIERAILEKLPTKVVFQYQVIPVAMEEGALRVATHDPFVPGLLDALRLAAGVRVRLALTPTTDIAKAAKNFYGVGADTVEQMIQDDRIDVEPEEDILKNDLSSLDQEASVVKFVNQVIWEAYQERATDIHMEPMEDELRIRYRIDGVLHATPLPPFLKRFQSAIISRIKVMANMDIAEKRLPQDGRISVRIKGEEIDVRVSTMPTVYGESVSLRLLMRQTGLLGLENLGLQGPDEAILGRLIRKPHGILLVTGPTGSGKSTSLYAWLHTINSVEKRIITVEDPIEYQMGGINQVQMKPEIGLTFAVGLRHILRQDPNVIMVGEIRDRETAEIAIRAALTGHLVFSTLHTNDAAGGITRLVDMGIEPFLVASSVEALVAQRLVRRLCAACKKPRPPDPEFLRTVGFPMDRIGEGTIMDPVGCEVCHGTGFHGRMGIYEIIEVTDRIRLLITGRASSSEIKAEALRLGAHTLRDDGWSKVLKGITTVEEVLRTTGQDDTAE